MITDDQVLARTLQIQPKLNAWLKTEMQDLPFADALVVIMLLFETGLEAARRMDREIS